MDLRKRLRRKARDAYFNAFELPLKVLVDRSAIVDTWGFNIPNNIYQTWASNLFGKSHHKEIQNFREINPELNFFLYDHRKCDEFMRVFYRDHDILKIYENALIGPMKSDIFRYCILLQHGGFYCDINKAITRPLSSFIQGNDTGLISFESNLIALPPDPLVYSKLLHPDRYVIQSVFGFQKNHPILQRMIQNICEYYPLFAGKKFQKPKDAILSFTGPGMFTKTVREVLLSCENLRQTGIDFEGSFVFNLRGANVMYLSKVKYTDLPVSEIISSVSS